MSHARNQLYVHLVWTTHQREPLITAPLAKRLAACIRAECETLGARVLALGGVADHVHLLVELPATVSVAQVAQRVKGASSHLVNHELAPEGGFRWQTGYGAFSLSPEDVERLVRYIRNQAEHHRSGTREGRWEPAADV